MATKVTLLVLYKKGVTSRSLIIHSKHKHTQRKKKRERDLELSKKKKKREFFFELLEERETERDGEND